MRVRRTALRGGLVVVLAFVAVLVGLGGSASAAVLGLESRTSTGVLDSAASKSVTVPCPAGKQVTGAAGFKTGGALGEVRLLAVRPASDLKSVVSTFREDENGFAGNWQATAQALCVSPLTGMQRVAVTSASTSASKSVTAPCPTGKRLVGMGGETAGGAGQVVIDTIRPNAALTSVTVTAREDQNGFAGSWTVAAYAVCAVAPQGLQLVSAAGPVTAGGPDIVADCPAGKGLLGVGGAASGSSGQVSLEPYALPGFGEPTRGVARAFEDEDGYAPAWTLTAYAICANTAQRVVATSGTSSESSRAVFVDCPAGKQVTGLGGDITGGMGEVWLQDLDFVPPESGLVDSWEDQTGTLSGWFIRAYAICATPLPGLEEVTAASADDSSSEKEVTVSCPAGKRVLGAAGRVSGVAGQVLLEDVAPNPALTSVRARGAEDDDLTGETWVVAASAMCANPPPGLQLVTAASEPGSEEFTAVTATCPTGKNLIGTGGEISTGLGQVVLDDLRPNAALTNVTVAALEDENGYVFDWNAKAHAICANP